MQGYRRRPLDDDLAGWKAGWRAISTYDVRARLPELKVPVLCVAWARRRIGAAAGDTPEEVAALMLYLAADELAFVTAQAISIDGGAYS